MASCDPDDSDGVLLLELEDELRKVFREVINAELKALIAAFTDQARRDLHEVAADVKRDLHDATVEVKHDLHQDLHGILVDAITLEGNGMLDAAPRSNHHTISQSSSGASHQLRRLSSPRTAGFAPQDYLPSHPQHQHLHGNHQPQHEGRAEKPRPPVLQGIDGAPGPDRKGPMEWCQSLSAGTVHGIGFMQRRSNSKPNDPPLPGPDKHKHLAASSQKEFPTNSRRSSIASTSSAPDPSMVRGQGARPRFGRRGQHRRGGSYEFDSLPAEENHVWMGRHRKCYIRGMEDFAPKASGTPKGVVKNEEETRQPRKHSKTGLLFMRSTGPAERLTQEAKESSSLPLRGEPIEAISEDFVRHEGARDGATGSKQSTDVPDAAPRRKSSMSDGEVKDRVPPTADHVSVLRTANTTVPVIRAPEPISPPPLPQQAPPALPCEVVEVREMQLRVSIPKSDTRNRVHPAAPEATDSEASAEETVAEQDADQATKSATSDVDEVSSQGTGRMPVTDEEPGHRARLSAPESDLGSARAESLSDEQSQARGGRSASLTGSCSSCSCSSYSPATREKHEEDPASTPGGSVLRSRSRTEKLFTQNNASSQHLLRRGSMTSVVSNERRGSLCRWVKSLQSAVEGVVTDDRFDHAIGIVIIANAVTMGVQTEYSARSARNQTDEPEVLQMLSYVFCSIFTLELLLRAFVYGRTFFFVTEWRWNLFDTAVVVMQLTEEMISLFVVNDEEETSQVSLSFVRILRGLRLVRIVRIVRIMHLLRELRSMVGSVICTFRSLLWTMVMLLLIVYIAGVYLTQQVATYGHNNPDGVAEGTALHKHFGGILRSIMSLFQAISGGIDWMELTDPLMAEISPFMGLMFALFICFTMFSMLNVVTGIFVESALKNTREETDIDMVNHLYKVFGDACSPEDDGFELSRITLEEFEGQLENPRLQAYFKSIDLDLSEARGLFELLDIDEIGSIDVEDFVMGCLRLRGPAKSIDLATLMSETRRMKGQWRAHMSTVEMLLGSIAGGSPRAGGAAEGTTDGVASPSGAADEKSVAEGRTSQAPSEHPVTSPVSQFLEPAQPKAFFPRRQSVGPYVFPEMRAAGNA